MTTSQAYRDSDEMAAALAYLIPTWCYSRIANPSTYYYEWTLALLEGYGFDGETSCCSTSSGMAAIMTAVQPFLVHTRHNAYEPRNFVATAQCYGGTFQQFNVRLQQERDIECRWVEDPTNLDEWAAEDRQEHPLPLRRAAQQPGAGLLRHPGGRRPGPRHDLPLICDTTVATPALLRPICHGADIVVQSATKTPHLERLRHLRRGHRPQGPRDATSPTTRSRTTSPSTSSTCPTATTARTCTRCRRS